MCRSFSAQSQEPFASRIEWFVENGVAIQHISAGAVHSVGVSTAGQIYVWGFGENFYRAGSKNFYYTPQLIETKAKFTQTASGQSHILALSGTLKFCVFIRLQQVYVDDGDGARPGSPEGRT